MKLIDSNITIEELRKIAQKSFGNLVKAVVDIEKEIMMIEAELHADQETFLLEQGSKQTNLWGINIYPEKQDKDMIEFDSMINLRPSQGNKSRGIEDSVTQAKVLEIVHKLIKT